MSVNLYSSTNGYYVYMYLTYKKYIYTSHVLYIFVLNLLAAISTLFVLSLMQGK